MQLGIAKNRQLTPRIALWQHRAMFAMFVFGEPERHFSLTLTTLGCGGEPASQRPITRAALSPSRCTNRHFTSVLLLPFGMTLFQEKENIP